MQGTALSYHGRSDQRGDVPFAPQQNRSAGEGWMIKRTNLYVPAKVADQAFGIDRDSDPCRVTERSRSLSTAAKQWSVSRLGARSICDRVTR
ncbi:hypothetical protein [uncultured Sphingorhabdus sp.]|uniref:hypothetical protein n=1 Tax=uncultured Sphingorhabdus sp. TaxID=1686106 RepID=UPI00262D3536|nr:hypothetical protein [uncultured Sphingorhabdus sp.]